MARGTPDRRVELVNGGTSGGGDASAANQLLELAELQALAAYDYATETTLDSGLGVYSRIEPGFVDVTGPTVIDTPLLAGRFFVRRIWIKGAYNIPDGVGVQFTVRLGTTIVALDDLVASQPYADSIAKLGAVESGGGEGELSIELSAARRVYYNIAVREV